MKFFLAIAALFGLVVARELDIVIENGTTTHIAGDLPIEKVSSPVPIPGTGDNPPESQNDYLAEEVLGLLEYPAPLSISFSNSNVALTQVVIFQADANAQTGPTGEDTATDVSRSQFSPKVVRIDITATSSNKD